MNQSAFYVQISSWGFPGDSMVKNPFANEEMLETRVGSLSREDPLEKEMALTPVFLTGKTHEQRSLVGYTVVHRLPKSRT